MNRGSIPVDKLNLISHNVNVVNQRMGLNLPQAVRRYFIERQAGRDVDPSQCVYQDMLIFLLYGAAAFSFERAADVALQIAPTEEVARALLRGEMSIDACINDKVLLPSDSSECRTVVVKYVSIRNATNN